MSKELRELAEAATPGPWYVQYGDDAGHRCMTAISTRNIRLNNQGCFTESEFESLVAITLHQSYPWVDPDCVNDDANSDYIAACSPDVVLALLDRLDRQERVMREALEYATFCWRVVPMNDYAEERTDELIAAIEKELTQ